MKHVTEDPGNNHLHGTRACEFRWCRSGGYVVGKIMPSGGKIIAVDP